MPPCPHCKHSFFDHRRDGLTYQGLQRWECTVCDDCIEIPYVESTGWESADESPVPAGQRQTQTLGGLTHG